MFHLAAGRLAVLYDCDRLLKCLACRSEGEILIKFMEELFKKLWDLRFDGLVI